MKWPISFLLFFACHANAQVNNVVYKTSNGKVKFHSEAQLEIIKASCDKLNGLINIENRNFAFAVPVSSFEGFNLALQKDHFNENYLESDKFPVASFSGKIIEDIDLKQQESFDIRAKGILKIHGIEQERIIKVNIKIKDGVISVFSAFTILLKDHDIKVPKIVHEKIASEISVEINADLKK